jgi:DNA-binding NarL/FixJ family response regulator
VEICVILRDAPPLTLGTITSATPVLSHVVEAFKANALARYCDCDVVCLQSLRFSLLMKKILIVDDDVTLRTALSRYLSKRGYAVLDAASAIEALVMFEADPSDLIVSDVLMPEMDGFEFCRRLRTTRLGQLVPFIFLSSKAEVEDRVQGHSIGADDYVIKPFEPRELLAKIEAQLERTRRTHAEIVRMIQQTTVAVPAEVAIPLPLPLTPAEEKVFWEVIQGHTNKQIGEHLFVSPRTVQTHLSNILNKLQLENRSQLVRFAFERGYKPPLDAIVNA